MSRNTNHWWHGSAGMAEVTKVAIPLVLSSMSWTLMIVTDRFFLLQYSADTMAAALPSGNLVFAVGCYALGVASFVNTFVAQYDGANAHSRIGAVVWQGVILSIAAIPVFALSNFLAHAIFAVSGHSPEMIQLELDYFHAMLWGAPAPIACAALSSFYSGRGKVWPVVVIDTVAALINVVLDYAWIFGRLGLAECGISGAGWATSVAMWCRAAMYLALFLRYANRATYGTLSGMRFKPALMKRLLWFGTPNGVQYVCEISAFTVLLLLVGSFSKVEVAATSLAFNLNSLAFMPVMGIGTATTTLVGQYLGANEPDLAHRSTHSAFRLAMAITLLIALVYVGAPRSLLALHSTLHESENHVQVMDTTAVLLRFVAFYCFFDALYMVFCGALRGAGDTMFILWTTVIVSAVISAVSWVWIKSMRGGLFSAWIIVTAWVCILGACYFLRFRTGKWRQMRVIEADVLRRAMEAELESTGSRSPPQGAQRDEYQPAGDGQNPLGENNGGKPHHPAKVDVPNAAS